MAMLTSPGRFSPQVDDAIRRISEGESVDDVESSTLDCKEEVGTVTKAGRKPQGPENEAAAADLAEAAACFANSDGGAIIVGVNDKGAGPDAFVGTTLDADWLRKRIWQLSDPRLAVEIEERQVEGARLLVLYVASSPDLHRVGKKTKHRIDKDCFEMTPDQMRQAKEDHSGYDWSGEKTSYKVDAVSEGAVDRAREYLHASGEGSRAELAQKDTPEFLRQLGVLDADGYLNRAGVLLFVPPEDEASPLLKFVRREVPGGSSLVSAEEKRPLMEAYHTVRVYLDAHNRERDINVGGGVIAKIRQVPELAAREAIVNALMHRDYRLPGPVDVEFVGEQLVVNSPGGFLTGIDRDNILTHPPKPRNPVLTDALRSLRLAEKEGIGVDRMYREMIRAGHRKPEIDDVDGRVRTVLLGGDPVELIFKLMARLGTAGDDVDIALILSWLLDNALVTAKEIAPELQKTIPEASAALDRAEKASVVKRTARTSNWREPEYRLADPVRKELSARLEYLRWTAEETEAAIVGFLDSHDQITAGDLRELRGVSAVQSSRLLRTLREHDVIELGSEKDKGANVFYVPGPKFEEAKRRHQLN